MSEKDSNALLALLAGVAIGAGLGILFAPDSDRTSAKQALYFGGGFLCLDSSC